MRSKYIYPSQNCWGFDERGWVLTDWNFAHWLTAKLFPYCDIAVISQITTAKSSASSSKFQNSIPSPCIVNLVAPSKLPVVGVIWVTRPPENKTQINSTLLISLQPNHVRGKDRTLSRNCSLYLELQIERRKELPQTEKFPFFGSSSRGIGFVSKSDWMLSWAKLCDFPPDIACFCCSINRSKNVIQRLTSWLQLSGQLTHCGVKDQIQLCYALQLSELSLKVLSQIAHLLRDTSQRPLSISEGCLHSVLG